jgi:hypothetical protein
MMTAPPAPPRTVRPVPPDDAPAGLELDDRPAARSDWTPSTAALLLPDAQASSLGRCMQHRNIAVSWRKLPMSVIAWGWAHLPSLRMPAREVRASAPSCEQDGGCWRARFATALSNHSRATQPSCDAWACSLGASCGGGGCSGSGSASPVLRSPCCRPAMAMGAMGGGSRRPAAVARRRRRRGRAAARGAHSNAINLRIPPEPGALHFREF